MKSNWFAVAGLVLILGLSSLSGGWMLAEAGSIPTGFPGLPGSGVSPSGDISFSLVITPTSSVYWGAYVSASEYGLPYLPPWDMKAVDIFESHAGKKMSVLHWGLRWYDGGTYERLDTTLLEKVRQRGALSLLDWESADYGIDPEYNQPTFALSKLIDGTHDAYIRQWATDAKNWGQPFFLRFDYEMNGDWSPWSESRNGNRSGQYVQAWRHVHDIFTQVGATNVTWVWCPNVEYPGTIPLEGLYPGDAYVDWTCMDGYNWGNKLHQSAKWQTFYDVFKPTYDHILQIAPTKPMLIGETSSSEYGGSKANWIADALSTQLPNNFPKIKALVWFNVNADNMDWVIESSPSAQAAFAAGIASSYYAVGNFADLNTSPVPLLGTEIRLTTGSNAISLPYTYYTASSLIAAMNAQGGSVTEANRWTGRNWQAYVPGKRGNDFQIEAGVGYIVKAKRDSVWTPPASAGTTVRTIKIDKGWSMLGVPACKAGTQSCYTASTLAAAINAQGGRVAEINRWVNGSWSAYRVGYTFNDFPIMVGQGYFIRATKASTWTP